MFLPSQRGSCLVFLSQPSSDKRVERRKLALAVQQVSGFCLVSAPLRRCWCGERLRSASVLYSASEHLCSRSVVKTVNTGVTQRINGNDRRVVLLDKQDFPHTPPPPAPWAGRDDVREQLPINIFTGLGPDRAGSLLSPHPCHGFPSSEEL